MKLIMEGWRDYLCEQEDQSFPARSAALIWNDSSYRPVDKEILAGLPEIITPDFLKDVPQGHAGIVLIKELKNPDYQTYCVSLDFGPRPFCSKKDEGFTKSIRQKFGVFVQGQVLKRSFSKKYNFFENTDEYITDILKSNAKKIRRSTNQVGYVPDINFDAALSFGSAHKCRLYTVLPHMGWSKGDNCGSFALKVAAAGLGKSGEASGIAENMVGPDEMLPKMLELGWIEFAESITV